MIGSPITYPGRKSGNVFSTVAQERVMVKVQLTR